MKIYRTLDGHIPNIGDTVYKIDKKLNRYRVTATEYLNSENNNQHCFSASFAYDLCKKLNNNDATRKS